MYGYVIEEVHSSFLTRAPCYATGVEFLLGISTRVEPLSLSEPLFLTENIIRQLPRQHCICRVDSLSIIKSCESLQQLCDVDGQVVSLMPIIVEDATGVNFKISIWGKIAENMEKIASKLPGQYVSATSALVKFFRYKFVDSLPLSCL